MKLAVLVKSCHRDLDSGCHDAIRTTWGRDLKTLGVETCFFVGRDPSQQDTRRVRRYSSDEVVVDCQDNYDSLPTKTRRMCQWVGNKMFKHVFLCDTDTLINAKVLLSSGFESFDYAGRFIKVGTYPGSPPFRYQDERGETYSECRAWASGGWGYFLSRRAAELIASTPVSGWAEDLFVGQVLAPMIDDKTFTGANLDVNTLGTSHYPRNVSTPYKPEFMKMAMEAGSFDALFRTGKLVA